MQYYMLKEVCEINPSKQIDLTPDDKISFVPMDSVSVRGDIDTSKSISVSSIKTYSVFREGDVLFAKITPCMENGKGCIAHGLLNGYGAGSTEFIVLRPDSQLLTNKWLYYFLSQQNFRQECKQHMTGSAGQKRVPAKYLGNCSIPVPSISEQQRIVARIEELFSQLDDAEATLQKTKAQLALYRQAVLKEAFDTIDGTECCIDNVCKEIKVGIVIKPTQYYVDKDGIFAFRNANVRRGYIDDCDWVMISKEGHIKNQKSEVHAGDVLISRSGANLGMASPVPDKYDGYNAIDVVIAVPDKGTIIPAYLAYYTNSPMGRSIVKRNERGAAQGHLNVTAYGRLPIVVPTLSEQQMIIEGIDAKTSVCDSIEQTVDETLQQAKAMRQSILQRVFNE